MEGSVVNMLDGMIYQKMMAPNSGVASGGYALPVAAGSFTPLSDTYAPSPIDVGTDWDYITIWVQETAFISKKNICGLIGWRRPGNTLGFRLFNTNQSGTSGSFAEYLGGGGPCSISGNSLVFSANVSLGVYAAGSTYRWAAWKGASA